MQVYLQSRAAGTLWLNSLVPLLQGLAFGLAVLVGLTRISDHKHHWSDVLTGLLVGAAFVLLVVSAVVGNYIIEYRKLYYI